MFYFAIDYGIKNCGVCVTYVSKYSIRIIRCETVPLTLDPYEFNKVFDVQVKPFIDSYLKCNTRVHVIHEYQPRFNKKTSILEFSMISLIDRIYNNNKLVTQESIHPKQKHSFLEYIFNTKINAKDYAYGKRLSVKLLKQVDSIYTNVYFDTKINNDTVIVKPPKSKTKQTKTKQTKTKQTVCINKLDDMADALTYCLLVFSRNFLNYK